MTLAPPNAELVAQAWLTKYAVIPAELVSGSLPKPKKDPKTGQDLPRTWTRFLTVRALPAGSPMPELVERRASVLQLDAWAAKPESAKPLWGVAMTMLEVIRLATRRDAQTFGKPLDMPVSGFQTARVLSAYLMTEPTRVENDPSAYAHMTCDLAVDWTV